MCRSKRSANSDLGREGVQATCLQVAVYLGEIHEEFRGVSLPFQAHIHFVSIKNASRTAGSTVLLLAYVFRVRTGDSTVKVVERLGHGIIRIDTRTERVHGG